MHGEGLRLPASEGNLLSSFFAGNQLVFHDANDFHRFVFAHILGRLVKGEHHARLVVLGMLLLRLGPVQGHVACQGRAFAEVASPLSVMTNRLCQASDLVMRRRHNQDLASLSLGVRLGNRILVGLTDFLRAKLPVDLTDGTHLLQLTKAASRILTELFDRGAVLG